MQLLGDPLGLERILTANKRLEHLEAGLDEPAVGEDAAIAGDPGIGMDGDEAWIESSGLISADQPPFGLSPKRGAAWTDVMRMSGNLMRAAAGEAEDPLFILVPCWVARDGGYDLRVSVRCDESRILCRVRPVVGQ